MDTKLSYVAEPLGQIKVSVEDVKTKYKVDVPINRCPFLDELEAVAAGYFPQDAMDLKKRARDYLSSFINTGYCPAKAIIVAYCEEECVWYLVDGIGRVTAMKMAEMQRANLPFDSVLVDTYSCPTLSDVRCFTEHCNNLKCQMWSTAQKIGSHAKAKGGEALKLFNDLEDYRINVIKTKSYHIVGDIYFGDKWSHMCGDDYKIENLRENHEKYKEAYELFVNNVGSQFDVSPIDKRDTREKVVRGQNPGIVLMSYLRFVELSAQVFGIKADDKIVEAAKLIVKRWSDGRASEKTFFESMKKNKSHKTDIACMWMLFNITNELFKGCDRALVEVFYNKWLDGDTSEIKQYKTAV